MTQFYSENAKLYVSVDCIVFGFDQGKLKLLIGRRKMNPGSGEWSLYGDFVGENETLDQAAVRTLKSLTGLDNIYMTQVATYGDLDRDPGQRVISVAYCSLINVSDYNETQLKEYGVEWVSINEVPKLYSDHNRMVSEAIAKIRRHLSTEPICFNLLPEHFTLTQLQKVYEAILGEEIDKRNFRKRIKTMECIQKTELIDKLSNKRGAAMYTFNEEVFGKMKFKL